MSKLSIRRNLIRDSHYKSGRFKQMSKLGSTTICDSFDSTMDDFRWLLLMTQYANQWRPLNRELIRRTLRYQSCLKLS